MLFFSVSRAISEPAVVYVEIEVSDCDEEIHFSDNLDGFSETQFVCSQAGRTFIADSRNPSLHVVTRKKTVISVVTCHQTLRASLTVPNRYLPRQS